MLQKPLFSNALGNMQCPQEHLKTIVYAKFGGQTKCIMGNSKIENGCNQMRDKNDVTEIYIDYKKASIKGGRSICMH